VTDYPQLTLTEDEVQQQADNLKTLLETQDIVVTREGVAVACIVGVGRWNQFHEAQVRLQEVLGGTEETITIEWGSAQVALITKAAEMMGVSPTDFLKLAGYQQAVRDLVARSSTGI
jgi:transcription initiation factor TFIIIB Brf1 subunit/transcription initiation factor TFIIB